MFLIWIYDLGNNGDKLDNVGNIEYFRLTFKAFMVLYILCLKII